MYNKKMYREYLEYNRELFNCVEWFYNEDDIPEDEGLDVEMIIYDDLCDYGFSARNINI